MSFGPKTRKLIFGGVCTLGVGCSAVNLMLNTVLLDTYQEVIQIYRAGAEVPIPSDIAETVESVMNDMNLSVGIRNFIRPFTVYGFDTFHAGFCGFKFGAIIGLPSNFFYSSPDDVEAHNITVRNESIDWASEASAQLKQSLLLSKDAKKFLIAREIASVHLPAAFAKSVYPALSMFLAYALAYKINRQQQLFKKPLFVRSTMYFIVSLFCFGVWAFLQDMTTVYYECEADRQACMLGDEYVKGALEAYSKLQQRNISLRELMGSKGPGSYTLTGNDIYFFRQKHVPLSRRKELVETYMNISEKEVDGKAKSA